MSIGRPAWSISGIRWTTLFIPSGLRAASTSSEHALNLTGLKAPKAACTTAGLFPEVWLGSPFS